MPAELLSFKQGTFRHRPRSAPPPPPSPTQQLVADARFPGAAARRNPGQRPDAPLRPINNITPYQTVGFIFEVIFIKLIFRCANAVLCIRHRGISRFDVYIFIVGNTNKNDVSCALEHLY
ncbi:hypothetical protein EVAR_102224_1 [Eumeta japonica]|uniref:Uncharacterized protein n=1 Tax=Eumeta variegata TaxID=151549 RepID=A0A4C1WDU4_EUMVA|nr:hypothetical protein EVAR_102224_1 [Eumeta japonica]